MEAGALRAPAALNRITVTVPLLRLRSDEQLVAQFRAGNDGAFAVIHDRYRQRLLAYSRQMLGGSRQDAEDALQDVFMRAYSWLRFNDRPLSLRAWLYRVAHNRCIDQLRKPVPRPADLFDTSRKPLHDPIAETERREDLRHMLADVRRLPDQQRSALLMREIDGLTYAELGEALGVTLPAVKSLLVRARIGLAEANEARDTACEEIRLDLVHAHDRGVRASGLARRHMRDCPACLEYRSQLRCVSRGLSALAPGGPGLATAAMKLFGLGGAGSAGAASAGGGAIAGSGALVAAGGATAAKVAAVVCCAALTAGGAAEVTHVMTKPGTSAARANGAAARDAARRASGAAAISAGRGSSAPLAPWRTAVREGDAKHRPAVTAGWRPAPVLPGQQPTGAVDATTGGATAPDEVVVNGGLVPAPAPGPSIDGVAIDPAVPGDGLARAVQDGSAVVHGAGAAHSPAG